MSKRRLGWATVSILRAISEGHAYGVDIVESTGIQAGTVYMTLRRLEKRSFVRSNWEAGTIAEAEGRPRRRYYRITEEGMSSLREALQSYSQLMLGASDEVGRSAQ